MRSVLFVTLILLFTISVDAADPASKNNRAGLDFFEKKIRPVLVEHCYSCHATTSKNLQGGLLVDSRQGLLKGGDSGASIVPGKVEESLLISALRYNDFEMPPKGKLPKAVIADFEHWIKIGAPDPRSKPIANSKPAEIDIELGRAHWAYQLPKQSPVPDVKNSDWPAGDIDQFILAKLEDAELQPTVDADRVVLIRRLYFDLIGLPPTPAQIEEFVHDQSPNAYERLVDQLLSSHHFGERWGRHWLDVVRFAESVTLRGFIFKESWRYRDYVIETFNNDRPFNRFIIEQIAGDLLTDSELKAQQRNLTGITFLQMGNSNLEDQDKKQLEMDFVDEQLDVISRGFLAQTVTCARCHDHKFDPIPQRDYYALAGILKNVVALDHANISVWKTRNYPLPEKDEEKFRKHESLIAKQESQIKELKSLIKPSSSVKSSTQPQAVAITDLPGIVVDDAAARKVGQWMHSQSVRSYVGDGYSHDQNSAKGQKTITFLPKLPKDGKYEVRFAYTMGSNRASNVPVSVFSAEGEKTVLVNEKVRPPIDGRFISLGQFRFEVNGQCFVIVSNENSDGHVIADAMQFIPVDQLSSIAKSKKSKKTPATDSADKKNQAQSEKIETAKQQLTKAESELKKLKSNGPKRPLVMTVIEKPKAADLPLHIRGSVKNLGETVPRGVLQVASYGATPKIPTSQSGRLELAHWIANSHNPLTARVIVNRAWHWIFGTGLVRTVDNFGTTGELPSHPELLDHLASRFIENDWSMKQLIKAIVMSRTYRLSSSDNDHATAIDPENRLLSRMNRRRLDAESLRDAILSVAGTIDLETGGASFPEKLSSDYGFKYTENRRSVYAPVFRNSLPEIFEAFDFANPSMVSGRRNVSTVAPQALFLMNHPFVMEQSQHAATRLLKELNTNDSARIQQAYQLVLGRAPTKIEQSLASKFLKQFDTKSTETQTKAWTQYFQLLFASIDFRYLH